MNIELCTLRSRVLVSALSPVLMYIVSLLYWFLGTRAHRGRNESTLAEMAGKLEVELKEFPALRSNMFLVRRHPSTGLNGICVESMN